MDQGEKGERGQRGKNGFGWSQAIVYLACFAAVGYSYWVNHNNIDQIKTERTERTNQSCNISERKQQGDVRSLKLTYDYLVSLTPEQAREPLNALIYRELPRAEKEARLDDAPSFCDEPGIGLPEPDPKVPERPQALK